MARKDKNTNLKDNARAPYEGKGRSRAPYSNRKDAGSSECGHSAGILPYLVQPLPKPTFHKEEAVDNVTRLRRLYKQKFGYKPVGMDEKALTGALRSHGVNVD